MNRVPKLRFKEFCGEWEEKKLGEISSNIMYGLNSSAVEFDGENKYIRITDINEINGKFEPNPLTSPSGTLDDNFLVNENDILFARTGASVGKTYHYNIKDGKLYFAGFLIRFHINKANSKFIYYNTLKEDYNKWVALTSMRTGQPGINAEEYKNYKIKLPCLEEQEKIADFLSSVDKKISTTEEKLGLFKDYKKGIMQKIFNQELRFKDSNGNDYPEWEEKKLGEISSNIMYGLNSSAVEFDGENKYIRITDINEDNGKFEPNPLTSPSGTLDNNFLVNENDILFARTGASVGKTYHYNIKDEKLYFAGFLIRFHINKANSKFIYYNTLKEDYNKWVALTSMRTGQPGINAEEYKNYKIKLPCLEEQQKIANFLSSIDNKIDNLTSELEDLKEFKKGLLQQMFV